MSSFGFQTNYTLKTVDQAGIICLYCNCRGVLQLVFFQVGQEGIFTKRLNQLTVRAYCKSSGATLPEKLWDTAIRHAGQNEKATIKRNIAIRISRRGRHFFWLLAVCLMVAAAILLSYGLGLFDSRDHRTEQVVKDQTALFIADPQKGDICQVIISEAQDDAYAKYTLFKIIRVDETGNKIIIAPHKEQLFALNWNGLSSAADHFDTGNPETFSLEAFRQMRFQKLKENPELVTRNIYSITRPE